MMEIILIAFICFVGGIISSVIGVGGGVMVLALLLTMMPLLIGSALHSILMLVGNLQKSLMLFSHISKELIFKYLVGAIPGVLLGSFLVIIIPASFIYLIFSFFLLGYGYIELRHPAYHFKVKQNDFFWIGNLSGISTGIMGAPGPIHAPFFLRYGLTKESFVATTSITTFVMHLSKLGAFWKLDILSTVNFSFLIVGIGSTVLGIYFGIVLLGKIPILLFKRILVFVLIILGFYYLTRAINLFIN